MVLKRLVEVSVMMNWQMNQYEIAIACEIAGSFSFIFSFIEFKTVCMFFLLQYRINNNN